MRERPIIFSGAMVRAILAGTKTQTRRVIRAQPHEPGPIVVDWYHPEHVDRHGEAYPGKLVFGAYDEFGNWGATCPYGAPGDRLWVRETFSTSGLASAQTTGRATRERRTPSCGIPSTLPAGRSCRATQIVGATPVYRPGWNRTPTPAAGTPIHGCGRSRSSAWRWAVVKLKPKRRLAVRNRLASYAAHFRAVGSINRRDIQRLGEVSLPQASTDMSMLIEDYPELALQYDARLKTFVGNWP